jgi:hypothetical protein
MSDTISLTILTSFRVSLMGDPSSEKTAVLSGILSRGFAYMMTYLAKPVHGTVHVLMSLCSSLTATGQTSVHELTILRRIL